MSLIPLQSLFKVAGAGVQGFGEDKQDAIKEALVGRVQNRDDMLASVKMALDQANARKLTHEDKAPVLGEDGFAAAKGAVAGAEANAQVPAHVATAVQTAQGTEPFDVKKAVDIAQGVAPIDVGKAVAIEAGKAPIDVKKAVDIATESPQAATGQVLPGANGGPAQLVVTGGKDHNHPLGSTIAMPDVTPKSGGGAGDVMAKRAGAALPQIDAALKNFDQYHEPGAAGRLFARSALGGWAISPEGQRANQAADAIATAYAGAKSRSGTPSMATIQGLAQQIKVQTGEGDNPDLVAAKIARAHAWRDEIAQLAGSNDAAGSGGTDKEFEALMASLTPKKKP